MADVWEKDLAQKSSLTTSDFIRVVGSDNVSYKQSVPEVTKTINSAQPTSSCRGSIKDWAFSTNGQGIIGTDNHTTDLPSASNLYGVAWTKNFVINTNHWVNLYWSPTNADDLYVCANRNNTTAWTAWEKMPTRAEVDALNSKIQRLNMNATSFTFTLPNKQADSFYQFIIFGGTAYAASFVYAGFIDTSASGSAVSLSAILAGARSFSGAFNENTKVLTITETSGTRVYGGMTIIAP